MRRREFIAGLGGAAAWPVVARAEQVRKVYQIGVLLPGTPATFARRTNAFLEGMGTLGYVEGRTINIEWRWGQLSGSVSKAGVKPRPWPGSRLLCPLCPDSRIAVKMHRSSWQERGPAQNRSPG
jgi:hypothetical protein